MGLCQRPDLDVDYVGGLIGGWLLGLLGIGGPNNLIGSIITAFIGGVVLVLILRALTVSRAGGG